MTSAKDREWLMSSNREANAVCWMLWSLDMQHRIIKDLSHTGKLVTSLPEVNKDKSGQSFVACNVIIYS